MKFVFFDKTEAEADIIVELLSQENIPYVTKEKKLGLLCLDEDDEEHYFGTTIYDIEVKTDLSHFDFIKKLADKRIS